MINKERERRPDAEFDLGYQVYVNDEGQEIFIIEGRVYKNGSWHYGLRRLEDNSLFGWRAESYLSGAE